MTIYEFNEKIRASEKAKKDIEKIKKEYFDGILSVSKEKTDKESYDRIRNMVNQCIVLLNNCDTQLDHYHSLLNNIAFTTKIEQPYL